MQHECQSILRILSQASMPESWHFRTDFEASDNVAASFRPRCQSPSRPSLPPPSSPCPSPPHFQPPNPPFQKRQKIKMRGTDGSRSNSGPFFFFYAFSCIVMPLRLHRKGSFTAIALPGQRRRFSKRQSQKHSSGTHIH
uniref:Uncharacterized protein n=1 Tax=Echinococcus granulosus TaxID=6210 RepID=A0A068X043_ECHGR|nr:hypothetical protein EgrG_002037300 [Echinococcus granulosus]